MGISAERRHPSLDRLCVFIFWFPFDVPTEAMEKQLCARIDLCQLAKNVVRPVPFCDGEKDSCTFVRSGEGCFPSERRKRSEITEAFL
jgi:hypothetical protein